MSDKSYENLDDCIHDLLKLITDYACEGVNANIGGPFGAGIIITENNKYRILVVERNNVIQRKDPTCHAEVNAIRKACKILDTPFLNNCILVSTSKSCPMCISAAIWAKIPGIYYASDYRRATKVGFKDNDIIEYLNEENDIIKEIKIDEPYINKMFDLWENKTDRFDY